MGLVCSRAAHGSRAAYGSHASRLQFRMFSAVALAHGSHASPLQPQVFGDMEPMGAQAFSLQPRVYSAVAWPIGAARHLRTACHKRPTRLQRRRASSPGFHGSAGVPVCRAAAQETRGCRRNALAPVGLMASRLPFWVSLLRACPCESHGSTHATVGLMAPHVFHGFHGSARAPVGLMAPLVPPWVSWLHPCPHGFCGFTRSGPRAPKSWVPTFQGQLLASEWGIQSGCV